MSARGRFLAATLGSLGSVLLSCSETTAPPDPAPGTKVSIASPFMIGPIWTEIDDSTMVVKCEIQFRATAIGVGSAAWTGIELRLYAFSDRSTPIDTYVGDAAEAADAWGGESIEPGSQRVTGLELTLPFSYTLDLVMRYRPAPGAAPDSAVSRARCEPHFPATAATPRVDSIVMQTVGPVEPGDSVRFTYHLASEAGLWQTRAWIASACYAERAHFERGANTRLRSVAIAVPPDCPLGDSITVGVTAIDLMFRDSTKLASPRLFPRDTRPPALTVSFLAPPARSPVAQPAGDFFVGDRIPVHISTADDGLLDHLSITASTSAAADTIRLPISRWATDTLLTVREGWRGEPELRFRLRDRAGLVAPERVTAAGAMRVHPHRDATARTIDLSLWTYFEPKLLVSDLAGVAIVRQENIRLISLATGAILRTITTPVEDAWIDLTPAGDTLFAFLSDHSIAALDLSSNATEMTRIGTTLTGADASYRPQAMVVLGDGNMLLTVKRLFEDSLRVVLYERPAGTYRFLDEYPARARALVRDRAGTRVLLHAAVNNCLRRLDVVAWSLGPESCGWDVEVRSMDDAADRFAIGSAVVNGATGVADTLQAPKGWYGPATASAFDPDGLHLYYVAAYTEQTASLIRVRLSDGVIVDRVSVPPYPALLRLTADGRRAVLVSHWAGTTALTIVEFP